MHGQPARGLFGLIAVGAATTVGITTHDAGFTALTFIGALAVPRILGLAGHRHGSCGHHEQMRGRLEQRLREWHNSAHGDPAGAAGTGTAAV